MPLSSTAMTTSSRPIVRCQAASSEKPIDPSATSAGCIFFLSIAAGMLLEKSQSFAKSGSFGGQSLGSVPGGLGQQDPSLWTGAAGGAAAGAQNPALSA